MPFARAVSKTVIVSLAIAKWAGFLNSYRGARAPGSCEILV